MIGVTILGSTGSIGVNTLDVSGSHVTIEGFDITGGTSRCVFHRANDVGTSTRKRPLTDEWSLDKASSASRT